MRLGLTKRAYASWEKSPYKDPGGKGIFHTSCVMPVDHSLELRLISKLHGAIDPSHLQKANLSPRDSSITCQLTKTHTRIKLGRLIKLSSHQVVKVTLAR